MQLCCVNLCLASAGSNERETLESLRCCRGNCAFGVAAPEAVRNGYHLLCVLESWGGVNTYIWKLYVKSFLFVHASG